MFKLRALLAALLLAAASAACSAADIAGPVVPDAPASSEKAGGEDSPYAGTGTG